MKIFRLAAPNNLQIVPQNPSGTPNPSISLQNMQNAQQALGDIDAIISAADEVNGALARLEDAVGGGDLGLKQDVSNKLLEALSQNPAVKLLQQMNLIPSPADLFNAGNFDMVKAKVTQDLSSMQTSTQQATANG